MTFAVSRSELGMGAGLLEVGNWNAPRFSNNPSGNDSANLRILARGQAETKSCSLLLIPSVVPTGLGQSPALQDLPVLFCLAQQVKKGPRTATAALGPQYGQTSEGARDDCGVMEDPDLG